VDKEIYGACDHCGNRVIERIEVVDSYGYGGKPDTVHIEDVDCLEVFPTVDGDLVCKSCRDKAGLKKCHNCDEWVEELDENEWCKECAR